MLVQTKKHDEKKLMRKEYKNRNKTLVFGVLAGILTSIIGFIFSKFFIQHVGTEVNGQKELILSILSYFTLVDGGIIVGVIAKLYIPIRNDDWEEVTKIVNSLERILKKVAIAYLTLGLIASFAFATIQEKHFNINTLFLFFLFLVHIIPPAINYMFFAKYQCLIEADNKKFILTCWNAIFKISIYVFGILILYFIPIETYSKTITIAGKSVVSKSANINSTSFLIILLIFVINMTSTTANFIIYIREKGYYKMRLIAGEKTKTNLNSLVIYTLIFKISSMIVFSTDTITLSVVSTNTAKTTLMITIYALYNTLSSVIRTIYDTVLYSSSGLVGRNMNKKEINKIMTKVYKNALLCSVAIMFIIVVATPIIVDMFFPNNNYFFPKIAMLFGLINLLYIWAVPSEMLISSNAHFKNTWFLVLIEAIINIIISIILVFFIGIYGVLVGTLVSMIFRFIAMETYNYKVWKLHLFKLINLKICFRMLTTIILTIFAFVWMLFEYKRGFNSNLWNSWLNPIQLILISISGILFIEPIISFVFPNFLSRINSKFTRK